MSDKSAVDKRAAARANFKIPELSVRGKIDLFEPITSRDEQVKELHYDYGKLTSAELVACLDQDPEANSGQTISNRQAFSLFAVACEKCERAVSGLDAEDISERLSARDAIAALRTAKGFFGHALVGALLSISKT